MIAYYEKEILKSLIENGGAWEGNKAGRGYDQNIAMKSLYEAGYISAHGPNWDTAVFFITDKGRKHLEELEAIE